MYICMFSFMFMHHVYTYLLTLNFTALYSVDCLIEHKSNDELTAEEGGHSLHVAKNNFIESSVSKLLLALL